MSSTINPGDRVIFSLLPQGIQDLVYRVRDVRENMILMDSVCLLTTPGSQYVTVPGSELSPLTKGENL